WRTMRALVGGRSLAGKGAPRASSLKAPGWRSAGDRRRENAPAAARLPARPGPGSPGDSPGAPSHRPSPDARGALPTARLHDIDRQRDLPDGAVTDAAKALE